MPISREALDRLAVLRAKVEEQTVPLYEEPYAGDEPVTIFDPKCCPLREVFTSKAIPNHRPGNPPECFLVWWGDYWSDAPQGALEGAIRWAMRDFELQYSDAYQVECPDRQDRWRDDMDRHVTFGGRCPTCKGTWCIPAPPDWDLAAVNAAITVLEGASRG